MLSPDEVKSEKSKAKFEQERAEAFAAMMKTQGWSLYVDLLNSHIADRTKSLFSPTKSGEEYLEQHNKGAVYGLLMARDIPSATVTAVKAASASGDNE